MYNEPQGKRFQFLPVKRMALHVLISGIRAKDPVFVVLKAAEKGAGRGHVLLVGGWILEMGGCQYAFNILSNHIFSMLKHILNNVYYI